MWFGRLRHGEPVRRRLARAARCRIADLADHTAGCVVGQIEPGEEILAPLSLRRCVYWAVTIEEVGAASDAVERGSLDDGVRFEIRDASGRARVIPHGSRVAIEEQVRVYVQQYRLPSPEYELFRRLAIRFNYPSSSRVRFREHALAPASWIVVSGHSQREPDRDAAHADASGYRGELPTVPVLSSTRRAPLLIASITPEDLARASRPR